MTHYLGSQLSSHATTLAQISNWGSAKRDLVIIFQASVLWIAFFVPSLFFWRRVAKKIKTYDGRKTNMLASSSFVSCESKE
jgi:hypothetical protein